MDLRAFCTLAASIAIAATALGCEDKWESGESWGPAVWAEDESGIAIIKYDFERKQGENTPLFRNFKSQILISANLDGERTPIGSAFEGRIEHINYQRQAGYVLVEHVPTTRENGGETRTNYAVTKLSVDGMRTVVAEHTIRSSYACNGRQYVHDYPQALKVYPNTNGSILGVSRAFYDCDLPTAEVELLDSTNLARQGNVMFVDVPESARQVYDADGVRNVGVNHVVAWNARNVFLGSFQNVEDDGNLGIPLGFSNYQNVSIGSISSFTEDNGQLAMPDLPARCFALPARSSANSPDGDLLTVNAESGRVTIANGPADLRCR